MLGQPKDAQHSQRDKSKSEDNLIDILACLFGLTVQPGWHRMKPEIESKSCDSIGNKPLRRGYMSIKRWN